jgi:hypothetical protein
MERLESARWSRVGGPSGSGRGEAQPSRGPIPPSLVHKRAGGGAAAAKSKDWCQPWLIQKGSYSYPAQPPCESVLSCLSGLPVLSCLSVLSDLPSCLVCLFRHALSDVTCLSCPLAWPVFSDLSIVFSSVCLVFYSIFVFLFCLYCMFFICLNSVLSSVLSCLSCPVD